MIREQLRALGRMKPAERRMLLIFLTTAVLWIFREPFEGWGWSPWLGVDQLALADGTETIELVDDGTVAMLMALICFMLPSGEPGGGALLRWQSTVRLPWGILFLFGGGLALAQGMETTGLDKFLGERLAGGLRGLPELAMTAVVAGGMTFLTEITSNLASLNMLLPVLAGTSEQLRVNPLLLMIPATISASCAFMLPVATAPNAIVYGSGRLRMADMIKAGICLNLIGVAMVVGFVWLLGVDH
jgi:sodium-dependent dicarboxylate transporter 2/3/5